MSTAPRDRARYGSLSRERIVMAALAIVDHSGLDALTMKALAADLDVGVMSLYRHVASREDLLDGIAELLAFEVELPDTSVGPWGDHVRAVLHGIRAVGQRHPAAFGLLELRPLQTEPAQQRYAEAIAVLDGAALAERDRAIAARALISFVVGFTLGEVSGRTEVPGAPSADEEFDAGIDLLLDGIKRLKRRR